MKRFFAGLLLLITVESGAQIHNDGDSIWTVNYIHDIYLNFPQTGYWDTLMNNHNADIYTKCQLIFDGRTINDIGAKFKGNSSFNNQSNKKPFKIDLNEFVAGQDYDGIKKFNLNNCFKDPTFLREKLALDFCNSHGIDAPRCNFARLYINNTYWGLYTIVEDVNNKFLTQHYGNNNGNLFKGDPSGDLKWLGATPSLYYNKYELDQTLTNDWSDLVRLISVINNTPAQNFEDSLPMVLNTWSFLEAMAVCNMFANLDSYIGSGHNYYIYHDEMLGIFHWIVWDVNESFGNFQQNLNATTIQTIPYNYINQPLNRPLMNNMMNNTNYHQYYVSIMCGFMNDFSNAYFDPKIDSLANVIRADVYADNLKFYTNQDFENNLTNPVSTPSPQGNFTIPGLKTFISTRRNKLVNDLSQFGCWLTVPETSAVESAVYPNPADHFVMIPTGIQPSGEIAQMEVFDITGKLILADQTIINANGIQINTAAFADGYYFSSITLSDGRKIVSKFSVQH
ncbi:MAG: hypothetical protein Fur0041_03940 [Bacteroidia bacterium]